MGKSRKIKRLFIANRGEIAVRIIQTCKEMGIETVTAYCPADSGSLFTLQSDFTHAFESNDLKTTYLAADTLIDIAIKFACDALHPGYGFLSENALFAQKCLNRDLIFIGPSPESISLMGDKISAREKVKQLNIPLLPSCEAKNLEDISNAAKEIKFPILVKASAGGGGRGMRIIHRQEDIEESVTAAKSEAKSAFGDDTVYIEKYLENCRHIEVQVFGDHKGNYSHLFERECSIQRRHQKVIEEAPSSALTPKQREEICQTAVNIAQGINYYNAGTVEFLWSEGDFYFLEMNTRIQVEHPVTEMISGVDIVKTQILIAEGNDLPHEVMHPKLNGHALEARIYAENPYNNFMPTQGEIIHVGQSNTPSIRLETSFTDGLQVPIEFDSMLAKLCAWSNNRKNATQKLKLALQSIPFHGITNNCDFLIEVLNNKEFEKGLTFTNFLENFTPLTLNNDIPAEVIAAFLLKNNQEVHNEENYNPWLSHE